MMTIELALPEEFKTKTKGLFGVWNDDPSDDFTLPDGGKISIESNDSTIHYDFGLKCKYEHAIVVDSCLSVVRPPQRQPRP